MLFWFVSQSICRFSEIICNGLQVGIAVVNDDSNINHFALHFGICCANGETVGCRMSFKPAQKKSVTAPFFTIAGIADVKQNMLILKVR